MTNQERVQQMKSRIAAAAAEKPTVDRHAPTLGTAWESLWRDAVTPWDLGTPTPALQSELLRHLTLRPQRSLIPGCGAGYDLLPLARHHQRQNDSAEEGMVMGLDVSETCLHRASDVLQAELGTSSDIPLQTRIELVHGDYFGKEGEAKTVGFFGGGGKPRNAAGGHDSASPAWDAEPFDFIFDYLFFCALPPVLRPDWGERTAQLLKPKTGRLLTLMFPVVNVNNDSNTALEGPPFPVTVDDYRRVLEPHGVHVEDGYPRSSSDTIAPRRGKELVCWWRRHGAAEEDKPSSRL